MRRKTFLTDFAKKPLGAAAVVATSNNRGGVPANRARNRNHTNSLQQNKAAQKPVAKFFGDFEAAFKTLSESETVKIGLGIIGMIAAVRLLFAPVSTSAEIH